MPDVIAIEYDVWASGYEIVITYFSDGTSKISPLSPEGRRES
jgi:hypothetical protein